MPSQKSKNPIVAANYLFKAISLASKPGIKAFVFIPLLINILVFVLALWAGIHYFSVFMDDMLDFSGLWNWVAAILEFIKPLLWLVFFAAYLIIVFYGFSILANIIAAPFNSLLAEATEKYLNGKPISSEGGVMSMLKDVPSTIWVEIKKLFYFLIRALPLLVLFLIPITAPIAPILWFLFSAWMMSLQYMDYPMGNHRIDFSEQRQKQKQRRMFSLGYGSVVLGATMLPIINFVIIPIAVIAATQIWVEQYQEE